MSQLPDIQRLADLNAAEIKLERLYAPVGAALDLQAVMPDGIKWQKFSRKFKTHYELNPVPEMLVLAEPYALSFVEQHEFSESEREGAVIYVIWNIWKKKEVIFDPEVKKAVEYARIVRKQVVEVHKAVSRVAKNKPSDSFEAGLKVNFTKVLANTTANQLADTTRRFAND